MFEPSVVPRGVRGASEWAARVLVIGVVGYFVLRVISHLSEVIIPVVVALLLAALLWPLTRRMSRRIPRGAAAGVTVFGTLAALVGVFTVIGTQVSSGYAELTDQVVEGVSQIRSWIHVTFGVTDDQFASYLDQLKKSIQSGGKLTSTATQAGVTVTHVVAGTFITLFSLYFFLYEGGRIWAWVVRLFPQSARDRVDSSGVIAWGQLSAFTNATVIVAATDAVGISIGALVLRVPFVVAIGLLVFVGAFVPVIGAALSGSVAVLLALVARGPVYALVMLGVVIAVQQLESHVLQPFLLGRAVRVHPLAVILAIAGGVVVAGIVGALIAVPIAACANAVGHHLLGPDEEPTPEPQPPDDAGALDPDPVPGTGEAVDDASRADDRAGDLEREQA